MVADLSPSTEIADALSGSVALPFARISLSEGTVSVDSITTYEHFSAFVGVMVNSIDADVVFSLSMEIVTVGVEGVFSDSFSVRN